MDRRTTIALALCLLILVGQSMLAAKYAPKRPPVTGRDTSHVAAPAAQVPAPAATAGAPAGAPAAQAAAAAMPVAGAQTFVVETPLYRATFSSLGARLMSVELREYAAAHGASEFAEHPALRPRPGRPVPPGDRVVLDGGPSFGVDLGAGEARRSLADRVFAASESTDATGAIRALTFTWRDSAGTSLRETWRVRPDSYLLDLEVEAGSLPAGVRDLSLTARSWPMLSEANVDNDVRLLRSIQLVDKSLHRELAGRLVGKPAKVRDGATRWAGVQTHYFLGLVSPVGADGREAIAAADSRALTDVQRARLPARSAAIQPVAVGTLVMPVANGPQRFVVYFGPADYFSLAKLAGAGRKGSLEIEKAVDLGARWLQPFSYPLLQALRWIRGITKNYALAIFVLATLIRVLLHPLNMSSMKSMRAMQRLQPEIERLRTKYKNDATALNAAMMALYRENGVNPAGGCLPMVLQMPILFAIYAVLQNAIDLRQAPLAGWIHDLSAPDQFATIAGFPIRILPLIMTATGLLQQRMMPQDPKQAPTMYMMNVFMLFIFYGLPSGLVFYWTVMNLYTALQQWLAKRDDRGVVVVPAGAGGARARKA